MAKDPLANARSLCRLSDNMRRSKRRNARRDPSDLVIVKRRPPQLYTLYSKDIRIDVLVGSPRVHVKERHVRQPFERERESTFEDQPHYGHYFPARVRISWLSDPEKILAMKERDILVESIRQLEVIPRDAVWGAATAAVETYVNDHPSKRQRYVDYDRGSQGVNVSWDLPAARHMLASGGARQVTPRAVKLRIKMLLDQAESSAGFRAESAREKAETLIQQYGMTEDDVRSLHNEFRSMRGAGEVTSRSLLGGREEEPLRSSQRLPPKRDTRRRTA